MYTDGASGLKRYYQWCSAVREVCGVVHCGRAAPYPRGYASTARVDEPRAVARGCTGETHTDASAYPRGYESTARVDRPPAQPPPAAARSKCTPILDTHVGRHRTKAAPLHERADRCVSTSAHERADRCVSTPINQRCSGAALRLLHGQGLIPTSVRVGRTALQIVSRLHADASICRRRASPRQQHLRMSAPVVACRDRPLPRPQ